MNDILKRSLKQLEMIGGHESGSGLVATSDIESIPKSSPEEFIALENAKKYKADYVYFRRFKDRPSVPQIYLYDHTHDMGLPQESLAQLHKQLYSSGNVPMFFVFTKQDIRIFNCFERPAENDQLAYKPLTTIEIAGQLNQALNDLDEKKLKAFSGRSFDNGAFWENSEYRKDFKFSNSAYETLLLELKKALEDIIHKNILPEKIARKIMVISILIKYLEEREDDNKNKVFPKGFFNQFAQGAKKFTDILNHEGAFLRLLDFLARHFNGGIFELDEEEREFISNNDLARFGQFLSGDMEGNQFVFWRLYSFNDLPVELISNIYEEFLDKEPGVVYTPPYLVNFLLDESMPLASDVIDCKVLDPACGSGVFLVGAYRRLIYRWRYRNNWKRPNLTTLKKLLRENIFGIELKKQAADLTVFSLSLALCDELSPLQIWEELKFDNLQEKNILHNDFFEVVLKGSFESKFDLVIGNPPFIESSLTEAAEKIEHGESKKRFVHINGKKKKVTLPRNQIALLFLEQSLKVTKPKGVVCLIQSAGPLLYNKSSMDFRRFLIENYHVPQIVDFSHIARILFGPKGDVPTAAIFLVNEKGSSDRILHVTTRRTKTHKEKLYFELDSYDFHTVPIRLALTDSTIWKSNYLGGSRYHQLTQKLNEFPKLKEYAAGKSWHYGAGIRIGNSEEINRIKKLSAYDGKSLSADEKKELDGLLKKFTAFKELKELAGIKFLPTEGLTSDGIDLEKIIDFPYEYCENFKNVDVYFGPHTLIKEGISNNRLVVEFCEDSLLFKEKIVGVQSKDGEELKRLSTYLKSKVVSYYLAATSAEFLIRRATSIKKWDIDNIPYDERIEESFSKYDEILVNDLFDYLIEFRSKGENSYILTTDAEIQDIFDYGKIFCDVLRPIYPSIDQHTVFRTESYICCPFYFGDKPEIDFSDSESADQHIEQLVKKKLGISLRLTRIVRLYEKNVIYFIKPRRMRYWLKSIALRDADETFSDLRKQGY